jgi:phosphate transport system substrate-binding protein
LIKKFNHEINMKKILSLVIIFVFVFSGIFIIKADDAEALQVNEIVGAGASFPFPLYTEMFGAYKEETGITVNYQSVGSSKGIQFLLDKKGDFGATDAPISDEDMTEYVKSGRISADVEMPADGEYEFSLKDIPILHMPTAIGAVAVAYNLRGVGNLNLSSEVLVDIFMGDITRWNDERIRELNPRVFLPNIPIKVAHRSDGSGTTFTFSDFLTKVSSKWAETVGRGKSLQWPIGDGGEKNPGVAQLITQNRGTIGYVSLEYALEEGLPVAKIQNKSGNFILPTLESASLAAQGEIPADTRVSITDTEAAKGYPISTFTWIIVYEEQNYAGRSQDQAMATSELLWWMVHEGQRFNENLNYARLPESAVKKAEDVIKTMVYDGNALMK